VVRRAWVDGARRKQFLVCCWQNDGRLGFLSRGNDQGIRACHAPPSWGKLFDGPIGQERRARFQAVANAGAGPPPEGDKQAPICEAENREALVEAFEEMSNGCARARSTSTSRSTTRPETRPRARSRSMAKTCRSTTPTAGA
jgi:hypothetical protein